MLKPDAARKDAPPTMPLSQAKLVEERALSLTPLQEWPGVPQPEVNAAQSLSALVTANHGTAEG
jgi:hypothetical protein